jgi:hypothetical protein
MLHLQSEIFNSRKLVILFIFLLGITFVCIILSDKWSNNRLLTEIFIIIYIYLSIIIIGLLFAKLFRNIFTKAVDIMFSDEEINIEIHESTKSTKITTIKLVNIISYRIFNSRRELSVIVFYLDDGSKLMLQFRDYFNSAIDALETKYSVLNAFYSTIAKYNNTNNIHKIFLRKSSLSTSQWKIIFCTLIVLALIFTVIGYKNGSDYMYFMVFASLVFNFFLSSAKQSEENLYNDIMGLKIDII